MKFHLSCCVALGCLAAAAALSARGEEQIGTLPSVASVAEAEQEAKAPPVPQFPEDWFQAPMPPGTLAPVSRLAPESAGTEPDNDIPMPLPLPDNDPLNGVTDFWSSQCHFWQETGGWMRRMFEDQCNFYSWENLAWIGVGVAIAAPLANTSADQNFRDWYQSHYGDNEQLNKYALKVKMMGEGADMIPAFLVGGLLGMWLDAYVPCTSPIDEWFGRTLRGWIAGAPTLLVLQYALGAERPYYSNTASHWNPFHGDHGASGHAFIGSMPFLTAAEMVDDPWLRGVLFAASFATGWSRIQTDDHFLSQVILGWWIAYRAAVSVTKTQEEDHRCWDVFPSMTPDGGAQVNVLVRY